MPKLKKPFAKVNSVWGEGRLDFEYAEEGRFRLVLCGSLPLRLGALNVCEEELTTEQARSATETLALLAQFRQKKPTPKGVLRSEILSSFIGEAKRTPRSKLKASLRSGTKEVDRSSLHKYCQDHPHAPSRGESLVVDHIIELQLLNEWNKEANIPVSKLKRLANSPDNLQVLGSLQNRAKAWVFLKVRQGYVSPQTHCPCFECVCSALLKREHLRCAGSLRTLASGESFACFSKAIQRAWEQLSKELAPETHKVLSAKMATLLHCTAKSVKKD